MAKKHKWDRRLSEEERELVASVNKRAWTAAYFSTPSKYRKNKFAIERSYSFILKCVLRASKTHDPSKGKFSTYAVNLGQKSATSQWVRASKNFIASISVDQEPEDQLGDSLDSLVRDPSQSPVETIENQEILDRCLEALKAFRPNWHKLVVMKYRLDGNDLSIQEINKACGISYDKHANFIIMKARQFMKSYADGLR